ncbi:succinate dehydrogenase [Massilia horti]|uniref:Succinate dehydrogenase n=1 Tax=Massilia horti TaxID=2562153 RepID=A0A4Y9T8B6_9BURK|nr:succinate dehydrogenase [Massilia horti]TFW33811.1 succinate dehydrogenase [Massilia horti]
MTDTVTQVRLWYWGRISSMVLAFCVLVHLAVIIYAVRAGLTGAAVLARTHGSVAFGLFYTVFVLACAVHAPLGMARIVREELGWSEQIVNLLAILFALLLLVLGLRAVYGVVLA